MQKMDPQGADGTLNDALHRGSAVLAPAGGWPIEPSTLFTIIGYDSRGNAVVTIDPKRNTTITESRLC